MECQKSDCFVVALILGNAKGAKETTNTRFMHPKLCKNYHRPEIAGFKICSVQKTASFLAFLIFLQCYPPKKKYCQVLDKNFFY